MKKFEPELNRLVNHIKDITANTCHKWLSLSHSDIIRISGASSYVSLKMVQGLRLHPNILFKKKDSGKPMSFRYVSIEEKYQHGLSANNSVL